MLRLMLRLLLRSVARLPAVYVRVSKNSTQLTETLEFYQRDPSDRNLVSAPISTVAVASTAIAPHTLVKTLLPDVTVKAASRAEVLLDVPPRNARFEGASILFVSVPSTLHAEVGFAFHVYTHIVLSERK